MPRKGANVTLSSYDEIFTTEEGRTESQQEHVQMIPLSELHLLVIDYPEGMSFKGMQF